MKFSGFLAASLDGFIAAEDGSLDFLDSFQDNSGEDYGYGEFFLSIDALLMGRKTFETVVQFPDWPYTPKAVYVYSGEKISIPKHLEYKAFFITGTPSDVVKELSADGHGHIYVDGGITISSFLREGLLDELTLSTLPILLGRGIPLFSNLPGSISLELLNSKTYKTGIIQNLYKIRK